MCAPAGLEYEGPRGDRSEVVRVWLLGGFRVSVGSGTIPHDAWRLRKAAALVKLLTISPGHRLHREQVMDLLWPDSGRRAASNNLRKTLHAARRILDPDEGSRYLASEDESLALCPGDNLWVDVEAFEEAGSTARHSRNPAACRAALNLYAGDLLPEDRYEEWAEERREELRRLYLDLLIELAKAYEGGGDLERSVETLRRAVAKEPTFEEAHAGLMRLYALLDRVGEALAQYQRLRTTLSGQLGTEPNYATCHLHDEIAAGRFRASPSVAPSPEALADPNKHNLPAPRTSFVGREQEMVEVKRLLAMTRLLTLTGVGGSGKTRLALVVGRDLVELYADGVWLVELAGLSEGKLVPQAVATALGIKERPGQPIIDTLIESLRAEQTLLLVDNCEHLLEATAGLVDAVLDSCPQVRIVVTSREALNVSGEVRWSVPALSVPGPQDTSSSEEVEGFESVRLFVERACQRAPTFALTSGNFEAVAEICRKLDGIPLALELAAARVEVLAVTEIASRLGHSLKLLTDGGRTVVPRQRTLRGTLDWSYELLLEGEKKLFRRLSVFAGGWTLEASEAVASGEGVEEGEVLDLLSKLVEKSLVVVEPTAEGEVRYKLLEPVRQHALAKLKENGEAESARRSHAEHFLSLAEEAEPELFGPREVEWWTRLEEEHDNVRVALSWSLEGADSELGLRLAGALRLFWLARGYYGEGRGWLDGALARDGGASVMARVKALGAASVVARRQGDLDRAKSAAEEGLRLSAEAGAGGGHDVAFFTNMLGLVSLLRGDPERATKLAEEGLMLSREASDTECIGDSLLLLGHASRSRGDYARAKQFYEEGLALAREPWGGASLVSSCLNHLGWISLREGDLEQATALFEEAAALIREQRSEELLMPLCNLGWVALLGGDLGRAKALHNESLALCHEIGDKRYASYCLEGLACVAGVEGEAGRAARLFGTAEALLEAIGLPPATDQRTLEEPYLVAARSQLDVASWEASFAEGKAMTLEQAVEYALSAGEIVTPTPEAPDEPATHAQPVSLTRREQEIAQLVARGLTNRQIATELSISEHTAATHVRRILKKLGLQSRSQIGSWLTQQRP